MITETWILVKRELEKWYKVPALIFSALIQPIVWITLFGNSFNPTKLVSIDNFIVPENIPPEIAESLTAFFASASNLILEQTFQGAPNYLTYLTGGVLSTLILFSSAFSGGSVIWDRRFGFLDKLLVAPIPRSSIYFAKVFSTVIKALIQCSLVFIIALIIPTGLVLADFNIKIVLLIFTALFMLAAGFSCIFVAIALRMKKWETLIAIANLVNLPLLFASGALFPISFMPDWLQTIARLNPITYSADLTRTLFITGEITSNVIFDFQVLTVFSLSLMILGSFASRYGLQE
jgi:ABC-2 type transport system permease protein|tara:strand:- start:66 stop:938 length:873 start_codon:yes stop_codon:yes gene_type:complete